MNRQKGFSLIEVMIGMAILGIAVAASVEMLGSLRGLQNTIEDKNELLTLQQDVQNVFKAVDNCHHNLAAPIHISQTATNLSGIVYNLPSLGMYDSAGALKATVLTAGTDHSIMLYNFRKVSADGKQGLADLVVRKLTGLKSPTPRDAIYVRNIAMTFEDEPSGGTMKLKGCQWVSGISAAPRFEGVMIGTVQSFSYVWPPGAATQTYTLQTSNFPDATMVNVNGTCRIQSANAGIEVVVSLRRGAQNLYAVRVCRIWGANASEVQTVRAGQLIEIPVGTTDVDIMLIQDDHRHDGTYWRGDADVSFYK